MAERDSKGRFVKGHKAIIAEGNGGWNAGKRRSVNGLVKDALKLAEDAMPDIIKVLIDQAKAGNVDAAKYLCNRIYGMPNQPINGQFAVKTIREVIEMPDEKRAVREAERITSGHSD